VRWLRLFVFLVCEQYAQISVFHRIFECCDCWSVGTPKKQCAVIELADKNCMRGGERNKTEHRGFLLFAKNWVLFCGDSFS